MAAAGRPKPFVLKGVCRVDDARRAVDAGVSGISVSNHGGNNLDGTPATIRALPAVAEAVGEEIEVLLDGGVRRGSDVIKALALGARAVMIGRAYLWGLAANGQAGVENVLDVLRSGIDSALLGPRARGRARPRPRARPGPRRVRGRARCPRRGPASAVRTKAAGERTRRRHLAGTCPRGRWCWCRWARPSSTARTCRWTPTPPSRPRWPTVPRDGAGRGGRAGAGLRLQRRAPVVRRARSRSAPRRCATRWSSWPARSRPGPGEVVFVNAHGGNLAALGPAVAQLVDEGHRVALGAVRDRAGSRSGGPARRAHRDLADAAPAPGVGADGPRRGR